MVFNGKEVQLDFLIGEPIVLVMVQVGMSISGLPEGFNPHKGIKRVFDGRRKAIESGEGVDWGFAEALAFGTLVSEGRLARPAFFSALSSSLMARPASGFVLYTGRSH